MVNSLLYKNPILAKNNYMKFCSCDVCKNLDDFDNMEICVVCKTKYCKNCKSNMNNYCRLCNSEIYDRNLTKN